jgi:hypothetical protein
MSVTKNRPVLHNPYKRYDGWTVSNTEKQIRPARQSNGVRRLSFRNTNFARRLWLLAFR